MNQDSAQSIVSELHQKRSALCGALARDLSTREAVRSARYCYALAESRVDVDAHGTVTGRNAEALKAEIKHILLWERVGGGSLDDLESHLQAAMDAANEAAMLLKQARVDFAVAKLEVKLLAASPESES